MKRLKKRGFSLGEILVAVAIMAVIAAVVIPSIGGQLNKGEVGRVSSDLTNIRSATEQFLADVRKYPASMTQLTAKPLLTDLDLLAVAFGSAPVARWRGPYMTKDAVTASLTGFGATILTVFRTCDATTNTNTSCSAPTGQKYLTIAIPGLSQSDAFQVDSAMDDGVLTTGSIRWIVKGAGGSDKDTLRYIALPIQ
jgi:prepilin-type N-terminal cleavage/methylation domain-containing protein